MPFATPDTDPNALLSQGQGLRQAGASRGTGPSCPTSRPATSRATSTCCARPSATRSSTTSASPTARSWARPTRALFPDKLGRVVLDGPVDADSYINHPSKDLAGADERLRARAEPLLRRLRGRPGRPARASAPAGATRPDPEAAFDALVDAGQRQPDPGPGRQRRHRRPAPGHRRRHPQRHDRQPVPQGVLGGYIVQDLVDGRQRRRQRASASTPTTSSGYDPDSGTFDPGTDRYFLIGAVEQKYSDPNLQRYFRLGKASYDSFDHFWFNSGYVELNYGIFPVKGNGIYSGPFTVPAQRVDAAGRRHDLRPGDAVPRREGPGQGPGQRAAADDGRRRPHRLRRRVGVHRPGGRRLPARRHAARRRARRASRTCRSRRSRRCRATTAAATTAPSLARQKPSTTSDGRVRVGGPHERQSGLGVGVARGPARATRVARAGPRRRARRSPASGTGA